MKGKSRTPIATVMQETIKKSLRRFLGVACSTIDRNQSAARLLRREFNSAGRGDGIDS